MTITQPAIAGDTTWVDTILQGLNSALKQGATFPRASQLVLDAALDQSRENGWGRDDSAQLAHHVLAIIKTHPAAPGQRKAEVSR